MYRSVASSLSTLTSALNERGKYVIHKLANFDPADWELVRYGDVRDFLQWKYLRKGERDNPTSEHYSGPGSDVRVSFQNRDDDLISMFTIHFKLDSSTNPLYRNVKNPIEFSDILAQAFLKSALHLNSETYKKLRARVGVFKTKEERIFERMYQAFHFWMGGSNYEKTVKWGQVLDKLTPYMPVNVTSSPKTTLFRLMAVDQVAFNKLMHEDKPLTLENRMYSSWTTNIKSAVNFATGFNTQPNQVLVIFKKKFTKKDVLVNIEQLQKFLLTKDKPVRQYSDAVDEEEIVIKNTSKNYQFTAKDVSRYQKDGRWLKS